MRLPRLVDWTALALGVTLCGGACGPRTAVPRHATPHQLRNPGDTVNHESFPKAAGDDTPTSTEVPSRAPAAEPEHAPAPPPHRP